MPFTRPTDTVRLQQILALSVQELRPKSFLQTKMDQLEDLDTELSTDVVARIVAKLDELDAIAENVRLLQASSDFSVAQLSIIGEYSVSYSGSTGADKLEGYLTRKRQLILEIARDLEITVNTSGRLYRS